MECVIYVDGPSFSHVGIQFKVSIYINILSSLDAMHTQVTYYCCF